MSVPTVVVHRDADVLAKAVAARIITRLVDAQSAKGSASLVLTGGTVGIATLAAIRDTPARDAVDWRRLDIWWGDERFLPSGDPERNETGARQALLDHVDVDPSRVHVMAGPDSGLSAEESADAYATELAKAARPEDHGPAPSFDVMLLGMGPDAHVASLFPGMPALYDTRPAVAVHGAPKPPPTRITLTLPVIQGSREVWVVAAGEEKSGAVRLALEESGPVQQEQGAAASKIPPGL
uniref:6-phosphogluconolactonase n=1 Tax=Nonomuraea harbinensis TaxID=1286938 RepID=UPI001C5F3982